MLSQIVSEPTFNLFYLQKIQRALFRLITLNGKQYKFT